ncbi:RNA polymerase recycling motor HelD [Clostridium tunisiense]|uniref:RNA polymerase recycling motor HelD n=1 Tax=Clostridium tunisiense TaxID=219748 RepID=UPI000305BD9D|nr:RNA polymerase recycling motor HelD [Clostridium tunisiense]
MSAHSHPEYKSEVERLAYTLEYLKNYNSSVLKEKLRIDREVEYGLSHYNSDNAEQFNELVINKNINESLSQKLKNLDKSLSKPYFARVDFVEEGAKIKQDLYIGKVSLMRDSDQELIIIDWRAPVATLYYEGRLGEASYQSADGEIKGEIKLKRQYAIEKAELQEIYDIDITTNDDFLQAALGSSKDNRLKDIVSTIQAEQNKVIRADMWKPLVVQGAAGGGKTTIALHRIAYLLYNYESTLNPKNFMIIAPNRFFLSYISEVLPDLGVENVLQTTFEDFALGILGKKLKLKSSNEKLSFLINNNHKDFQQKNNLIKLNSTFKSSLDFKDSINRYIKLIEDNLIPNGDFTIETFTLIKYERIREMFLVEYKHLPMVKRINEIKKTLVNTLRQNKESIIEEVIRQYDGRIEAIKDEMGDCDKRRKSIIKIADTRDALVEKIRKKSKTIVREYLNKFKILSPIEYYKRFLMDEIIFNKFTMNYIKEEVAKDLRVETLKSIESNTIEMEDLAPLMYIKEQIQGLDDKISVRHVVIDEAQDFSEFQLFILKKLIGGNSFTVLGDLCQGIYSYRGINNWEQVSKRVFGEDNFQMLTLEQSYRTTIEIMDAASKVINSLKDSNLPNPKPVIRHGEPVTIFEKHDLSEVSKGIVSKVNAVLEEGFKSVAIICKTLDECKNLKTELRKYELNVEVITGSESQYSGGVVLIPSYLVKGLEFDVVIIANASKKTFTKDPLDVKLLYVAMTRPLHRLYIYSVGEKAEMLQL